MSSLAFLHLFSLECALHFRFSFVASLLLDVVPRQSHSLSLFPANSDPHPHPQNLLNPVLVHFLRWAKSRDSHRRIASESYRCNSNR